MKKIVFVSVLICSLLIENVNALSLSCHSCILMDMDSGRVLYEKDANNPRLIASTTKIMTAILAIESNKLDETVIVGEEVLSMYGSNIYIEYKEKMKLIDLLYGLMLRSGNDAAMVIATYVAGSEDEFVKMMNDKAVQIGMKNTVYRNCHGLDEKSENKSTAYDMALLSSYAYKNAMYRKIVSTKRYTAKSDRKTYAWTNRNKLLFSYEYATGGKTGYTPRAGRTLVTNAKNNNLSLTAVTLNDGNEYISHRKMYDYAFENYIKYRILEKGSLKIDDKFYKDKLYIKNSFSYPLTEYEKEKVKVIVKLTKLENYKDNSQVGTVSVMLGEKEIYSDSVYVSIKKNKQSIIRKIIDWFN